MLLPFCENFILVVFNTEINNFSYYFCIKKYLDKIFTKKDAVLKASKKELICILLLLEKSYCS